MSLITRSDRFTRLELPEVLSRTQVCVNSWLESLPESARVRLTTLLPVWNPLDTRPDVLGAVDEEMPTYREIRELLVRCQVFFDRSKDGMVADNSVYVLSSDMVMLLLVKVLINSHWMLTLYGQAVERKLTALDTRELIKSEYHKRYLQEAWKSL